MPHVCPQIVVSDVVMEEMTGIDLAIKLRGLCSTCRVLLMSGAPATEAMLDDARQRGHEFEIFAKPFHRARLLEWVNSDGKAQATAEC